MRHRSRKIYSSMRRCGGRSGKHYLQLPLYLAQVGLPLESSANNTTSVNQVSHRKSKDSTVQFSEPLISHQDGVIDVQLSIQCVHRRVAVVHGNSEHLQAASSVLALPFHKPRDLVKARCAPCRPEIQQDNLASIVRKMNRGIAQIQTPEIRRSLVEQGSGGAAPTAVARQDYAHNRQRNNQAAHPSPDNGRKYRVGSIVPFQYGIPLQPSHLQSCSPRKRP
jgi:hypothetical protein